MKKIYYYLLFALVLSIAAIWITITQKSSTIKGELRDFAVEDTSSVDKIFMANKSGVTLLLERKAGHWVVNGKYEARNDLMDLLLYTMHRISVISPVSRAEAQTIVKKMAAKSIKVEIYQHGELFKTYYVGGPTQNSMGTYMILEGSSLPFVMGIREFRGYVASRYVTNESEWKSTAIFRTPILQIKEVVLEYGGQSEKSFKIEQSGPRDYRITRLLNGETLHRIDTNKVSAFLSAFKKIHASSYVSEEEMELRDSLLASSPKLQIKVTTTNGQIRQIKLYKRQTDKDLDKDMAIFDVDHMYGFINNDADLVLVQYFVFDPIMKEYKFFLP